MPYLKSREITSIALLAALWGVLNSIFSPILFRMTGLPFLCDLIGFAVVDEKAWNPINRGNHSNRDKLHI
jgi:hypothetical protein